MKKNITFLLFCVLLGINATSFAITESRFVTDDCSKITLQSGQVIEAVISTISETEVYYRPCNYPNSPLIVVEKSKIWNIKSPTGALVFKNAKAITKEELKTVNKNKEDNGLAITGFILSLVVGFLALPFCAVALHQINKNPNRYNKSSRGLAIAGLVISSLGLLSILFLFALLSSL
jgi:hypothetical protein